MKQQNNTHFSRYCKRCNTLYLKTGRYNFLCHSCIKESLERNARQEYNKNTKLRDIREQIKKYYNSIDRKPRGKARTCICGRNMLWAYNRWRCPAEIKGRNRGYY